jgi:hypothetical protein
MSDETPSPGDAYYRSTTYEVVYHVTDDGTVLTFTEYPDVATFRETHGTPDESVDAVADLPAPDDVELSSSEE